MANQTILSVSQILAGSAPSDKKDALRLCSIHGMRMRSMRSELAGTTDARKAARLRTALGDVEVAVGLLDTWADVL